MNEQSDRVNGTLDAWHKYRGRSLTRLLTGVVVFAVCAMVGLVLVPDHAGSWIVTGVVGFLAALVHPMALLGWMTIAILSFDVIDIDLASTPRMVGGLLVIVGLTAGLFRNSRGVPYIWAIVVTWIGFLLIHPVIFLVLTVIPMAMIYANRRSVMRASPDRIDVGPTPDEWARPIVEVERDTGLRYIGTVRFHYSTEGHSLAAVYRLPDGRGLAVALEQWLVTHRFGSKVLFTTSARWTVTLPGEVGQLAPGHDFVDVVRTQRRVLARLLKWGLRPDRPADDVAMAQLVRQFELDSAARRQAGPMTVLRAMVDEELNVRRDGGECLLDSAAGIRELEQWAES